MIKNKGLFYKALVAKGYFLPSEKSPIITIEFLRGVREGDIFCPKLGEMRFLPCNYPPANSIINGAVVIMIEQHNF